MGEAWTRACLQALQGNQLELERLCQAADEQLKAVELKLKVCGRGGGGPVALSRRGAPGAGWWAGATWWAVHGGGGGASASAAPHDRPWMTKGGGCRSCGARCWSRWQRWPRGARCAWGTSKGLPVLGKVRVCVGVVRQLGSSAG